MLANHSINDVPYGDQVLPVYLALPAQSNGVVVAVLQEIFGVNANIRAIADGLAAQGFTVVAPDLFWRQKRAVQLDPSLDEDRQTAMKLMAKLNRAESVVDGDRALDWISEQVPHVKGRAAIGYCFGGGVAYLMASSGTVNVGVSYYGTGIQAMLSEMTSVGGRLLLHIAADDHLCPGEAQIAIKSAAENTGGRVSVVIHPDVGHAFAREGGAAFSHRAAASANEQTLHLLRTLVEA